MGYYIKIPKTMKERTGKNISKESGFQMNEMQIQKLEKGIFIGDSAATKWHDWVIQFPKGIWFCNDWQWTKHQVYLQGTIGCDL